MTRSKKTFAIAITTLLLSSPIAFADQSTTPAGADNGAAAQKDANKMKQDSMKSGEMKPGGMTKNTMKSEQGSSTPAGSAADTEKKM